MGLFNRQQPRETELITTPAPDGALAIPISRVELARIERLLVAAWDAEHGNDRHGRESPVPAMMKALHKRTGAAAAAADHAGVPLGDAIPFFEHEVATVERAYRYAAEHRWFAVHDADKKLVDQLHARLGYAEAVHHLGEVPVFHRQLPRQS